MESGLDCLTCALFARRRDDRIVEGRHVHHRAGFEPERTGFQLKRTDFELERIGFELERRGFRPESPRTGFNLKKSPSNRS